jgi:tRNA-dihydrouridine synthase
VTPQDVFDMLRDTGAAGVMIGRGALGNPWIFEQALSLASSGAVRRPSREERLATIERHVSLMTSAYDDRVALASNLKKYVTAYAKGLHGSAAFRERVLHAGDADTMVDLAREFFAGRKEAA